MSRSRKRFAALRKLAGDYLMPHLITSDAERAAEFLEQALSRGHEGIMAKSTNAVYAAGNRGQSWLKVKRARTLDLVILAAEWGHGRRRGWLSNLHLGARDTVNGGFAMLGKTFKGLTDQMLEWQTQELLKLEIGRDNYTVYVAPKLVAEIAFNEIQVSPRYASGLALRFARVKRYRTDKTADQADTFQTVQKLAGFRISPPPLEQHDARRHRNVQRRNRARHRNAHQRVAVFLHELVQARRLRRRGQTRWAGRSRSRCTGGSHRSSSP